MSFDANPDTSGMTAAEQVLAVLSANAECFLPERADDWTATLHFDVEGAGEFTLAVADGAATASSGFVGEATCVVDLSAEVLIGMATGEVDAQKAFMQGKITASNLTDMLKYATSFDQRRLVDLAKQRLAGGAEPAAQSTPVQQGLNRELLGKRYLTEPTPATPETIKAYALATNDNNPRYLDEDQSEGIVAPPLYAVRLNRDPLFDAILDPELNADVVRLLHGEQDMVFHSVIRPGEVLTTTGSIEEIIDKETGQILNLRIVNTRAEETVAETVTTLFIRSSTRTKKKSGGAAKSRLAPELPEWTEHDVMKVDDDQTYRYADASLDRNPIHVDPAVAKAAGMKGIFLQGLCTMAFCQRSIINLLADGDPARLRRIKVRFSKPVFPGDELRFEAATTTDGETLRVTFHMVNQDGDEVITAGLAELSA